MQRRKGICFYCMYNEHNRCDGDHGRTVCACRSESHDLRMTKAKMGMDPDSEPKMFPEMPAASDHFYFTGGQVDAPEVAEN